MLHEFASVPYKVVGIFPFPFFIGRGEVVADIASCDRSENCIGKRVQHDISVAVGSKTFVVRNFYSAQRDRVALAKSMAVIA